ncbi:MAG: amidase [Pseudomonadota bacterium]
MSSDASPVPPLPHDPYGAFCTHTHVAMEGAPDGPLHGLTLAVKDAYAIAGHRTGNGNPTWHDTHPPAQHTASAVTTLLDAGTRIVGKTHCDELCYALNGENVHYGTPDNPAAPGRIPGGSSSGSAVAVAAGLADIALGSDTGGSVRLPASYCGIYGIRTTHGRIAADGVVPLAPSFDTVGWFTADAALFERVGMVMLPDADVAPPPTKLRVLGDAFSIAGPDVVEALQPGMDVVAQALGAHDHVRVPADEMGALMNDFRVLQGADIWRTHGAWIKEHEPHFGPGIAERFAWTATITNDEVAAAGARQAQWRARVDDLLADGAVIALPVAPGAAPVRDQPAEALEKYRFTLLTLLSLAGLAGLPQVSLPLGDIDGLPVGFGLIGARGSDRGLLALAARLGGQFH